MNFIDLIYSYKKLLDEGVLSEEEFMKVKEDALKQADTDQADAFELLRGFKTLEDDGLITQEEFNEKKQSLLNNESFSSVKSDAINPKPENIQQNNETSVTRSVQSIKDKLGEQTHFDPQKLQGIKGNKKVLIIGAIVAAVILLALLGGSSKLTDDEQHVVDCVKSVSYDNTLSVSDAYVVHHEYSDGDKVTYAVIVYSGTNSYGSALSGTAVFKDGSYLMDYYDDIPNDGSYTSLDKAVALRDIKLAQSSEISKVNIKKINKALKESKTFFHGTVPASHFLTWTAPF
jgi:hypothetical protein